MTARILILLLLVLGWSTGVRAAALSPPNATLTLAGVPLEQGEEAGPLTLHLHHEDEQYGPMIWAGAGRRRDHRGAVLESAVHAGRTRLTVRVLIEPRHSNKPYAFHDPGEVGRFTIELSREGHRLRGSWTGAVGGRPGKGAVEGDIAAATSVLRDVPHPERAEHPRLLIRRDQIETLRRKAKTDWGKAMMKRLAAEYPSRSNMAVGRGLLYVLTGDRAHAAEAQRLLEADIDEREWLPVGPVHDPAHTATEACVAYDLIHDACDQDFHDRMQGLLARSVRDLYWFSNVVRPNGNDASNWSAMYRAGCGMAALSMSTDKAAWPPEPGAPQLPRLVPPKDLAVGDGVPIVKLRPGKEWHDWLWAGPFKLAPGQDALEGIGGAAAARPAVGTKVGGKGVNGPFEGAFQPAPQWLVTEKTHRAATWSYGSFMLGGLHGKSLCGREPFTTVYFYCVVQVDEPGYYRVDLVDYQLDNPCIYMAGRRLVRGDYIHLAKGLYPVMAWIPTLKFVPTNSHDRQNMCFRLRLNGATDTEAQGWLTKARAWHAGKLEQWREDREVSERCRGDGTGVHPLAAFWLEAARQRVAAWCVTAVGDRGWNSEGEAYNQHSYRLVLPLAHCYQNATGRAMAPGSNLPWVLPGYVMRTICRDDGAVMHNYTNGGGGLGVDSYARGFALVPPELRAATLWTWNRTQALADAGKLRGPWLTEDVLDPMSAAFMFVNYPLDVKEQNPGQVLPRVMVDDHKGGYVFRNRWQDGEDLVATILLNKPQPGARNSDDTGCFRISGLGGDWAVRGANALDGKQANRLYLPDHPAKALAPAERTYFAFSSDGSGIISMELDAMYPAALPGAGAKVSRSFAVDYSGASGAPGLFVVADTVEDATGAAVWQMVTEGAMRVTAKGNQFTIDKGNGATLVATVVQPAGAKIETLDVEHKHEANYHDIHRGARFARKVIRVTGGKRFVIVMTVQKGKPPELPMPGEGADASIKVGRQVIRFDGQRITFSEFGGARQEQ